MSSQYESMGLKAAHGAMARMIEHRGKDPKVQKYAAVLAPSGSTRERVDVFASHIRLMVTLTPDAANEECLGLFGTLAMGHGDADDIAVAIGTLCAAVGIETRLVIEQVGRHAWTVHLEAKVQEGWYRP